MFHAFNFVHRPVLTFEADRAVAAGQLTIEVQKCGIIRVDFSRYQDGVIRALGPKGPDYWRAASVVSERMRICNAFLACLHSSLLTLEGLGIPTMVLAFTDVDWDYGDREQAGGNSMAGATRRLTSLLTWPEGPSTRTVTHVEAAVLPLMQPICKIKDPVLNSACTLLAQMTDTDDSAFRIAICDLYLRSVVALSGHDQDQALTTAWLATEALLGRIWNDRIVDHASKNRRDRLRDYRTYTMAVCLEILLREGHITEEFYNSANAARSARNKWIHSLGPVSNADVHHALSALTTAFELVGGPKIRLQYGGLNLPGWRVLDADGNEIANNLP